MFHVMYFVDYMYLQRSQRTYSTMYLRISPLLWEGGLWTWEKEKAVLVVVVVASCAVDVSVRPTFLPNNTFGPKNSCSHSQDQNIAPHSTNCCCAAIYQKNWETSAYILKDWFHECKNVRIIVWCCDSYDWILLRGYVDITIGKRNELFRDIKIMYHSQNSLILSFLSILCNIFSVEVLWNESYSIAVAMYVHKSINFIPQTCFVVWLARFQFPQYDEQSLPYTTTTTLL